MKCKLYVLCSLLCWSFSDFAENVNTFVDFNDEASMLRALDDVDSDGDWDHCGSKLKLVCALIKTLHAKCISAKSLNVSQNICAAGINASQIATGQLQVSGQTCFGDVNTGNVCAKNIIANSLCLNSPASFSGGFQACQPYRATITFAADTVYTLGTTIEYNTILDDPNNDISFSPDTIYTVPVSGYYIITLQVDQSDLTNVSGPLLGSPIANLQILVNGTTFRESFTPFLTFYNSQHTNITALAKLNAGDQVSSRYFVYVMSDSGFTPVTGTVVIQGNGTEVDRAFFSIHYLSSNCPMTPPCATCPVPPCTPFVIDCQPCTPCCA